MPDQKQTVIIAGVVLLIVALAFQIRKQLKRANRLRRLASGARRVLRAVTSPGADWVIREGDVNNPCGKLVSSVFTLTPGESGNLHGPLAIFGKISELTMSSKDNSVVMGGNLFHIHSWVGSDAVIDIPLPLIDPSFKDFKETRSHIVGSFPKYLSMCRGGKM